MYNPMAHIIEAFKYAMIGTGRVDLVNIFYCSIFTVVLLVFAILKFNSVERRFMDTV
jgi:lipopolysaccharide transport system permease protein